MNGKLLFPNVCLRVHVISAIITENKVWCPVEMCLQMNTIQGEEVGMIISERRESWAGPLMWSAISLLTGQDGKLLFTSLIHVLSENANSVCMCVKTGGMGACTVVPVPMRADPTKAENNQPSSLSPGFVHCCWLHHDGGSPSLRGPVLYLIHLCNSPMSFSSRISTIFLLWSSFRCRSLCY